MAENIGIRAATNDDRAALDGLAVAHGYQEPGYFARCLDEQRAGRRTIFIAEDKAGQAIGYVMLNRQSRYQPFRSTGAPEIQDLFVLSGNRRGGVGAGLVAACESMAQAEGFDMIGLGVGLHAEYGAAQRLYVRLGYMPDGFGVVYDTQPVRPGEQRPVDDDLNLMMVKSF